MDAAKDLYTIRKKKSWKANERMSSVLGNYVQIVDLNKNNAKVQPQLLFNLYK